MNALEELKALIDLDAPEGLNHIGTPHEGGQSHSGRYPWGSGKNPGQHQTAGDWLMRVKRELASGKTESQLAEEQGMTLSEFRAYRRIANRTNKMQEAMDIRRMADEGMTNSEIGRKLGINESSVRSKLAWYEKQTAPDTKSVENAAAILRKGLEELGPIDIGPGVARRLGITDTQLETAVRMVMNEGYDIRVGRMNRVTEPNSDRKFTVKVLGPEDLPKNFVYDESNYNDIHSIMELDQRLDDGGRSIRPSFIFPESLDSSRLQIKYAEEGGEKKDGLIELRRGVKDLDLGDGVNYSQVRILVDGTHYLKGMAAYSDDLPDGIDIRFNTNKPVGTPLEKVLKEVKRTDNGEIDKNNPFGSLIKENGGQSFYDDPNGKYVDPDTGKRQSLSLINKRAEEGDWKAWTDTLPAQFLSKQPEPYIRQQLKKGIEAKREELAEIESLTNPTLKRHLLMEFADGCDTNAVTLKAPSYPGQKYQVILPLESISEREVYAPNYEQGSKVALIRYPHGGTFEIPILTVNNKNAEGRKLLTDHPKDAIGINKKTADILSGADFDGDTVQVIPLSSNTNVYNRNPLKDLQGFDPKEQYPKRDGMAMMKYKKINPKTGREKTIDHTQKEMGSITNLISDMTLLGASDSELARAVKHSMVVIDAAKHELDYKRSEKENGIKELKDFYQGKTSEKTGRRITPAGTIVSRAGGQASGRKTIGSFKVDPETGEKIWKYDEHGTKKSTQMAETNDAYTLVSKWRHPAELAYADYANELKAIANEARKKWVTTVEKKRDPEAARKYSKEVESLNKKLNDALSNKDRERLAHIRANARVRERKLDNPSLNDDNDMLRKVQQQELVRARTEVGAKRERIEITDREWEAIQAGAIGKTSASAIFRYMDPDRLRERAMPRSTRDVSPALAANIRRLAATPGVTNADIASRYSLSPSVVSEILSGKE